MQHRANIIEDLEVDLNVISEGLINSGLSISSPQKETLEKFTFVESNDTEITKLKDR